MLNSDVGYGGIYRSLILKLNSEIFIYTPGIMGNFDYKNKENVKYLPKPIWCAPILEAIQYEDELPCWTIFENGDSKRPIIVGYLGKGIKYSFNINSNDNPNITISDTGNIDYTSGNIISDSGWLWPVPGYTYISSPFGPRSGGTHYGIDIAGESIYGKTIVCTNDGVVNYNGWNEGGYGWWVRIQHANNIYSIYGHMCEQSNLKIGQTIKQGDVIGKVGSTGHSTGPHLHFEIRVNGTDKSNAVNPLKYVSNK